MCHQRPDLAQLFVGIIAGTGDQQGHAGLGLGLMNAYDCAELVRKEMLESLRKPEQLDRLSLALGMLRGRDTTRPTLRGAFDLSWDLLSPHEQTALNLYKDLLDVVQDASVYLEEYTRGQIGAEELHVIELKKMLRDYGS